MLGFYQPSVGSKREKPSCWVELTRPPKKYLSNKIMGLEQFYISNCGIFGKFYYIYVFCTFYSIYVFKIGIRVMILSQITSSFHNF